MLTDDGYVGEVVHVTARVASAAHGGQVVVSDATRAGVRAPESLQDLGAHRLKDIPESLTLFQLGGRPFPPLRTISSTNLPNPVSPFIGRERELAETRARLAEGARLLTLVGPGGSGKTRLAIELAAGLVAGHRAGVFWVGLASIREPALAIDSIARTIGAKGALADHVGDRDMVLVLDNLEQVIDVAVDLGRLLVGCPNLTIIVTSRQLLRVEGEVGYRIPPLAPDDGVALFCARSGLEPSDDIAALCAGLDDLPLAIELAAARTTVLTPARILDRIGERLDLFRGARDSDPRQRTLRATIEWSYELLSPAEQVLFRRLGVFASGFRLEAAELIADAELDTLQSLVEQSLVESSARPLPDARDDPGTCDRAARRVRRGRGRSARAMPVGWPISSNVPNQSSTAPTRKPGWRDSPRSTTRSGRRSASAAMRWSCASPAHAPRSGGSRATGPRAGAGWTSPCPRRNRRTTASAPRPSREPPISPCASSTSPTPADLPRRASRSAKRMGDESGIARSLRILGLIASVEGDTEAFRRYTEESAVFARRSGDGWALSMALNNLGYIALANDPIEAAGLFEEALGLARRRGDQRSEAFFLENLALAKLQQDRPESARDDLIESLGIALRLGFVEVEATDLVGLAAVAVAGSDHRRAALLLGRAELLLEGTGGRWDPIEAAIRSRTVETIEQAIGRDAFEAGLRQGRDQASLALVPPTDPRPGPRTPTPSR